MALSGRAFEVLTDRELLRGQFKSLILDAAASGCFYLLVLKRLKQKKKFLPRIRASLVTHSASLPATHSDTNINNEKVPADVFYHTVKSYE